MNDLKQNIKYFSFARFFCHDLQLWKKQGEIDADNLQLKTFHPCVFSFQYFIALKTISTFLERYLIRTYSMRYRIIVAQMCRIKQNFKNHTRFLYSTIDYGERVFVVLVWYGIRIFGRENFCHLGIIYVYWRSYDSSTFYD